MENRELEQIGETIKEHQHQKDWGTDLEFDPITGEFKQVPKGTGTDDGIMITDDGFAVWS